MRTYLCLLLCVLSTKVFAQQVGNMQGKIVDEKTNQPIEYVGGTTTLPVIFTCR